MPKPALRDLQILCLATFLTATGCSSASQCNGDFCVAISSSFYSKEPCEGVPSEECTYANVYFTAKNKNVNVTTLSAGGVEMSINDRRVGVEGDSKLTTSNGLVIQLMLDQSYSITESGSTEAVRSGASQFIRGLADAALISVSVFASEDEVPVFLNTSGAMSTSSQILYDKTAAESVVQQFYKSYAAQTSNSQTKLYDAVGALGGLKPTGAEAEKLQSVMVVFTDGADTASSKFRTPEAVRTQLTADAPNLKIYAIGLGAAPNAEALGTISDKRFFRAENAADLQKAFDEVSKELTAIYLFRVLVAGVESGASGRLKVTFESTSVEQTFKMSATTASGSGGGQGGGGAGGGTGGGSPVNPFAGIGFSAVWGSGPSDVWAVGMIGATQTQGKILRWNGSGWTSVSSTSSVGPLKAIWGSAANDAWAVGTGGQILRWDGTTWTSVPSGTTQTLNSVWGTGPSDVWAVGEAGTITHWNGTAWAIVASGTTSGLTSVWASGPNNAYAAGVGLGGLLGEGLLRWDGASWTTGWTGTTERISRVWGSGPADVWAIYEGGALHFDGLSWLRPPESPSYVGAIWGSGPTDMWAACQGACPPLIYRWSGTAWNSVAIPNTAGNIFGGWSSAPNDAWAVGSETILRWNGSTWR